MPKVVKVFSSPYELAMSFAEELVHMINKSVKIQKNFTIALSGGSTPEILFTLLGDNYSKSVPWKYVHFFWGDERCVPPDNIESNFGMTMKALLSKINIPSSNIHRIKGEEDPQSETIRYSEEISHFTVERDGLPSFDLILLGLGEDGHTASIFPGHLELMESDKICVVSLHPVTHQKRISLTGRVINNAGDIAFIVTGKKKEEVVEKILINKASAQNFPASYIVPFNGRLSWFLDKEAGRLLEPVIILKRLIQ